MWCRLMSLGWSVGRVLPADGGGGRETRDDASIWGVGHRSKAEMVNRLTGAARHWSMVDYTRCVCLCVQLLMVPRIMSMSFY